MWEIYYHKRKDVQMGVKRINQFIISFTIRFYIPILKIYPYILWNYNLDKNWHHVVDKACYCETREFF